jgi:adenosine deaminase
MSAYRSLPKVLLHDHLDGGLRPATVIDLAAAMGYSDLPSDDLAVLSAWFFQGESTSLERYLDAFSHTFGVMQDPAALARVAYESAEDLAADGVVYAEIRFGPSLHIARGLTRHEVIEAVLLGTRRAEAEFGISIRLIVDALRQDTDSAEVARAAVEFVGEGVVGFDLAGPEAGFPPSLHAEACEIAASAGLHLTIHAGEGDGVASIAGALAVGAERIGHGARIVEDTVVSGGEIIDMGPVASVIHDREVPLEICPTSNLHTGMYPDIGAHPVGMLYRAGFAVTLNTDNRLMSGISLSDEFALVADHHGFGLRDFEAVTARAAAAAFCDDETRVRTLDRVAAGYAAAR